MHRFHIAAGLLIPETVVLPEDVGYQITRVLRMRPGAQIALFSGDGREHLAVLERVESPGGVTVRVLERRSPDTELPCRLHVALAVLKGEKLDWAVQKLTELGAARITLMLTERTIVSADERGLKRLQRYQRIAREAAEQSGRVRVPEIVGPANLGAVLGESGRAPQFFLHPYAGDSLAAALRACPSEMLVLIGPEGGFTEAEVQLAREAGAAAVRLGKRVLRAETAAITAAAIVAAAAEE